MYFIQFFSTILLTAIQNVKNKGKHILNISCEADLKSSLL